MSITYPYKIISSYTEEKKNAFIRLVIEPCDLFKVKIRTYLYNGYNRLHNGLYLMWIFRFAVTIIYYTFLSFTLPTVLYRTTE